MHTGTGDVFEGDNGWREVNGDVLEGDTCKGGGNGDVLEGDTRQGGGNGDVSDSDIGRGRVNGDVFEAVRDSRRDVEAIYSIPSQYYNETTLLTRPLVCRAEL